MSPHSHRRRKTFIGGLAIERANRSLLFTRYSVTLWLVPSEPIREQTLKALRTPSHLLHQAVFSALGDVTVLEIEEALRVKPARSERIKYHYRRNDAGVQAGRH